MNRLQDKVAIITGAGSGFGLGMARRFAAEGARVVLADVNVKRVEDGLADISSNGISIQADVSRKDDMERVARTAFEEFGRIDIMVNNAGFTHRNMPLTDVDEHNFDLIVAVNMKALYYSTQLVVPIMEHQGGGVIINTASATGLHPRKGLTWYCASKSWVVSATKAMALELAERNIRVNCLCPAESDGEGLKMFSGGRHAGSARSTEKHHSAWPVFHAEGCCGSRALAGLRRCFHGDGRGARYRWRLFDLIEKHSRFRRDPRPEKAQSRHGLNQNPMRQAHRVLLLRNTAQL